MLLSRAFSWRAHSALESDPPDGSPHQRISFLTCRSMRRSSHQMNNVVPKACSRSSERRDHVWTSRSMRTCMRESRYRVMCYVPDVTHLSDDVHGHQNIESVIHAAPDVLLVVWTVRWRPYTLRTSFEVCTASPRRAAPLSAYTTWVVSCVPVLLLYDSKPRSGAAQTDSSTAADMWLCCDECSL